jgi:hypothetical protein
MTENIKNNKTNPFPRNRKPSMLVQREIAVFRRQNDVKALSILHSLHAQSVLSAAFT